MRISDWSSDVCSSDLSLGKAVHFRQANAEHAPYGDGSFDLVVSHILLHELSCGALDRVLAECHRLLRPGGIMLHVEVPIRRKDPLDQFLWNWDTTNNNEPFWSTLDRKSTRLNSSH